jgi:sporulation protein YlmC with PRC-barrel domain
MTTTDPSSRVLQTLDDSVVVGSDGSEIGRVGQVYTDNDTGQPSWVTVKTGWFGTNESFVPLEAASIEDGTIRVPYDKDMIKGAPNNDAGEPLSESDEQQLYSYYNLTGRDYAAGYDQSQARSDSTGTDIPAQRTVSGDADYLTRSEEELHVGTEKVQVVREPVAPGDTVDDVSIGEAAADVVLTEERVVVNKETVPVEKVRLDTETVTEQQDVTESVRKEQIEFDDDTTVDTDPTRRTTR